MRTNFVVVRNNGIVIASSLGVSVVLTEDEDNIYFNNDLAVCKTGEYIDAVIALTLSKFELASDIERKFNVKVTWNTIIIDDIYAYIYHGDAKSIIEYIVHGLDTFYLIGE